MTDETISAAAIASQAFYFIERRRMNDARRVLREGLLQFPQDPDLLFHSAQVDWLSDNTAAAEETVRQLLVMAPHHAPARQLFAALLTACGEYAEAELLLIGLLRDYPESAGLYGRYAHLMLKTLHLDKAEELAREGLRYDPDDDESLLALALCETARRGSGPNVGLGKLVTAHPESLSTVHALVIALVNGGRLEEAHRIAQTALRSDPSNEDLVKLVRELRIQNHWSMKPLWPLQKWGWGASAAMWLGAIFIMRTLDRTSPKAAFVFAICWIIYAAYSWIGPPLIRRIL